MNKRSLNSDPRLALLSKLSLQDMAGMTTQHAVQFNPVIAKENSVSYLYNLLFQVTL